ncbi:Protein FAR1-RELATED SEQUENCE 11 [Glycine soja]|uniref:Protein FAR1-RELATED SEQUENCE 11 n=1 Tax=Glycine soja TaxID=3848 RepID=A0A445GCJ8_GLYSO|nr:Protein FAR1-RELATED SEQUENCE 11 [Glycine soja]
MGEGSTSTRDMSTDKINVDLNEYPIEDISLENGYSGTVSEHFDHDIVANDVLEVEEIETYEKENIVSSSQNIEINEFAEEVDRDETYNETNIVPFVGQIFLSEEEAFAFYKRYAYQHGFSVRKGRFIKRNGIMRRRDFFCHREGRSSLKIIEPLKEQRNRESTRCECKAYLRISLQKSHDIFPSEWRVTKFVVEHNHVLLTQSEVRFLPANRTISEDDIERIFLLKEGGLSVRQLMRVIELEKNVKHGYLPFIERDIRNLFVKTKKKVERNNAKDLLKYCEDAKKSCSKFQYAYTLDEERRLEHIFWSPASCSDWYQKYGDVVVFDTTYKVNSYEMPFGIFVGMNSHGKTVLFGCALLRNETISAFRWLMKVDVAIDDIKQKEDHDIMLEKCKRINLKLMSPLQEQAHGVLTRFAFQKFQEEFERSTQYSIHHENGNEFVLRYYKDANSRKHMVFWDGKIATCSCKYFEFWGILCRHILSIFLHKDCHEIPSNYLPSRWRLQTSHDDDEVDPQQVNVVFEEQVDVVHCPPPSKTKGRPKRRRLKGGKELSHNMNTCGLCKDVGHNIVTCPLKENTQFSGHTNKKKKICKDANLNPILLPKV